MRVLSPREACFRHVHSGASPGRGAFVYWCGDVATVKPSNFGLGWGCVHAVGLARLGPGGTRLGAVVRRVPGLGLSVRAWAEAWSGGGPRTTRSPTSKCCTDDLFHTWEWRGRILGGKEACALEPGKVCSVGLTGGYWLQAMPRCERDGQRLRCPCEAPQIVAAASSHGMCEPSRNRRIERRADQGKGPCAVSHTFAKEGPPRNQDHR